MARTISRYLQRQFGQSTWSFTRSPSASRRSSRARCNQPEIVPGDMYHSATASNMTMFLDRLSGFGVLFMYMGAVDAPLCNPTRGRSRFQLCSKLLLLVLPLHEPRSHSCERQSCDPAEHFLEPCRKANAIADDQPSPGVIGVQSRACPEVQQGQNEIERIDEWAEARIFARKVAFRPITHSRIAVRGHGRRVGPAGRLLHHSGGAEPQGIHPSPSGRSIWPLCMEC
jgi:hypothetical protein